MEKYVEITIDGKKIEAAAGSNLLQVARDNGISIPGLCYHKKLTPTGACRLCVTKIEGMRGLVMSCTIGVTDGLKVIAFDDELEEARRHTLEYLLAEQNEDYDGSYIDELRQLTEKYSLTDMKKRRYPKMSPSFRSRKDESSPVLTYDAEKCIKCFRCIKACSEVQGKDVLSFADRGMGSYIVAGLGTWSESECDGCGECVQLCPTGAIVEKPNRKEFKVDTI